MAELWPSKPVMRVRSPSSALAVLLRAMRASERSLKRHGRPPLTTKHVRRTLAAKHVTDEVSGA